MSCNHWKWNCTHSSVWPLNPASIIPHTPLLQVDHAFQEFQVSLCFVLGWLRLRLRTKRNLRYSQSTKGDFAWKEPRKTTRWLRTSTTREGRIKAVFLRDKDSIQLEIIHAGRCRSRQLVNYALWHIFCWPNSDVLLRTDALYFSDLHACAFYGPLTCLIYYRSVKLRGFRKSRCPRPHKYNAIIAIDWSHESEENQRMIVKERNESAWCIGLWGLVREVFGGSVWSKLIFGEQNFLEKQWT